MQRTFGGDPPVRRILRNILIRIQRSPCYRSRIAPKLSDHLVFGRTAKNDAAQYFYCSRNKQVIGHLYLYQEPDLAPGGGWWVYGLFVHRLYRHLNIGSSLLNRVFEFLRERKDSTLYVLVQKDFMDVIRFYEKLGFCINRCAGPDNVDLRFVLMSRNLNEKTG
jgi:GNAT superfamily N-acetyltransferase